MNKCETTMINQNPVTRNRERKIENFMDGREKCVKGTVKVLKDGLQI